MFFFLASGIPEEHIAQDLVTLFQKSTSSSNGGNCAQHILEAIENRFYEHAQQNNVIGADVDFEDMGLLIHFFHHPLSANSSIPTPTNLHWVRPAEGEVRVAEVKEFVQKYDAIQQKREKHRLARSTSQHEPEKQMHNGTINPYVKFDAYERLLNENQDLRQTTDFMTDLLMHQPASVLEEKLASYLEQFSESSSLRFE